MLFASIASYHFYFIFFYVIYVYINVCTYLFVSICLHATWCILTNQSIQLTMEIKHFSHFLNIDRFVSVVFNV